MFQTHLYARIPSHPSFPEPLLWSEVEHDIHRPWFYVCAIEAVEGDFQLRRMMLISQERSLQALLQAKTPGWKVESVLVMTPSHINGTNRWQLEGLDQITLHWDPVSGSTFTYKIEGGHTYTTDHLEPVQSGLTSELIFDKSMLDRVPHDFAS